MSGIETVTAIVLARGGSVGVPGKNIAPIAGRMCIAWTIADAISARSIDRVIVSSDSTQVLEEAERLGVEAIERERSLASSTATVDDAARSVAERFPADAYVLLYGNVPVRPAGLLDRAVTLLRDSGCDSVQSYQSVGKNHPWWTARLEDDGAVRPWEGDVLNHGCYRRQDLPPAFIPDGGVLAVSHAALMLERSGSDDGPHAFFGTDRRGIENPYGSVIDIDEPIDLLVADAVLRARASAAAGASEDRAA